MHGVGNTSDLCGKIWVVFARRPRFSCKRVRLRSGSRDKCEQPHPIVFTDSQEKALQDFTTVEAMDYGEVGTIAV